MTLPLDKRKFKATNRRELLKLALLVALGAFAVPKLQAPLLKKGLAFSDWMSDVPVHPNHSSGEGGKDMNRARIQQMN